MKNALFDTVKIMYSNEGYLPDFPYHLVSDEEMIDAFAFNESNYLLDNYPCLFEEVRSEYNELVRCIRSHCYMYLENLGYTIPDWVLSYMIGAVVGPNSSVRDVHDFLVLLNLDNLYDEFTPNILKSVLDVSKKALGTASDANKGAEQYRPPTMFGEPHVVKYLRLEKVSVK